MPQINFTSAFQSQFRAFQGANIGHAVPDSSPIIKYSPLGAWGDSDAATDKYTNGTFHFTYVAVRLLV